MVSGLMFAVICDKFEAFFGGSLRPDRIVVKWISDIPRGKTPLCGVVHAGRRVGQTINYRYMIGDGIAAFREAYDDFVTHLRSSYPNVRIVISASIRRHMESLE